MKLINLHIENFQGIKAVDFGFDGRSANIYGDNATGKTTIYNAFTWLLFNKTSTEITSFTPKPKDNSGDDVHNLESSVRAQFDIDGLPVTLKKIYREIWTRKNGEATIEFKGNTNLYFIDEVQTKESDYKDYINEIMPVDKAKILANPLYFSDILPWQERRKILFSLCGEISDEDVIAANPKLAGLPNILGNHTIEKYRNTAAGACKKINSELELLPSLIEEARKAMPDITGISVKSIESEIRKLENEKAEKQIAKATMSDKEILLNLRIQVAELETEFAKKKRDYSEAINAENKEIYDEINETGRKITTLSLAIANREGEANNLKLKAKKIRTEREQLKVKHDAISAESWNGYTICPVCTRPLEPEKIAEASGAFQAEKRQRMDAVIAKVKETCSKDMEAEAIRQAEAITKEIEENRLIIKNLESKQKSLEDKLKPYSFDSTDDAVKLRLQISELRKRMLSDTEAETAVQKQLENRIAEIEEQISVLNEDKAKFTIAEAQKARIAELCTREKELAEQFEELRQGLSLCDDFIQIKAKIISENVCARFKSVSFSLFKNQLNGGVQEICEVLVPSENGSLVPFSFANKAAQINAGIEIIATLSKHWNLELPLFVDNRESIIRLKETKLQIISLIVSEKDKSLRLEVTERSNKYVA